MCEKNYKNLPLDLTGLDDVIQKYISDNQLSLYENKKNERNRRLEFSRRGEKTCLVILYFNSDGTSTIAYKQGQNPNEGKKFADYLHGTISPEQLITINMSLLNIPEADLNAIIDILQSEFKDIEVQTEQTSNRKIIKLHSSCYNDSLTITHCSNRTLIIQGRPLTCYKRLIYYISDLLDFKGLERVLTKQDDSHSSVLNSETAKSDLKVRMGEVFFNQFPENIKSLLISSFCIKSSSPILPDYCMLLYPEFRSLEGMIKQKLSEYSLDANNYTEIESFSGFFTKNSRQKFVLKPEYQPMIVCQDTQNKLCDAYFFFNKHRNGLFHMNEHVDSSRMISDIHEMNRISETIYNHLKNLL